LSTLFWDIFQIFLKKLLQNWFFRVNILLEVNTMEEVLQRIKQVILDSGLSYVDLEKRTGIAKSSLQRYATGKTKKIPLNAVELIAKATNSSASWIMGWSDENIPLYTKEDAVADIFIRLRADSKFLEAAEILYSLNEQQLDAVITMLSSFK
jgi:transcriptional regulator with XRE-family HTH domain